MKLARRFRVALLVLIALQIYSELQPFTNQVRAAGGDVVWEQQLAIGFNNYPLQVLIDGQQLIVVGASVHPPNEDDDPSIVKFRYRLFVAAYDLSTGTGGVVWSDAVGMTDGDSYFVRLAGLVVSGQDIFVTRHFVDRTEVSPNRTFLRKYDRLHGTLLWEQVVYGGASGTWVSPSSLAATGGKVFVSGATGPFVSCCSNVNPHAFTRAYNGTNGHVIWSSRSPVGSGTGASAASGNQVFVVLRQGSSQFLRAYNATTGAKLWERMIDPHKSVGPIKVNGSQLFLAGSTNTGGNYGTDYVVQSDRIDTGTLLWENTLKNPGDDSASDLVVASQKAFIGGTQTNAAGSQDFMVKAFDALTGRLLWKSLADAGGSDSVSGVVANSSLGMVFAVGIGGVNPPVPPDYQPSGHALVRAYNMNTGALAWESFVDDGSGPAEYASQAVVAGERLFVVGGTSVVLDGLYPGGSVLIRAYDAK